MRKKTAVAGSAGFLLIAPGVVAGVVPWRLTRWQPGAAFPVPVRFTGGLLTAAGSAALSGRSRSSPWRAGALLRHSHPLSTGGARALPACPQSHVPGRAGGHHRPGPPIGPPRAAGLRRGNGRRLHRVYHRQGRYALAVQDYSRALSRLPSSSDETAATLMRRAASKSELGQRQAALQDLRTAGEMCSNETLRQKIEKLAREVREPPGSWHRMRVASWLRSDLPGIVTRLRIVHLRVKHRTDLYVLGRLLRSQFSTCARFGGMEHVLIVEMPGRSTRPGRFKPGSAARSVEAACRTDLDGFRLISLSSARSADRAWRPADSVRVVEVTIRTYERRDAAGVADVFYRSVREVALSDYTPEQVRAWVPGRWDAER